VGPGQPSGFQSAREFLFALEAVGSGDAIAVRPEDDQVPVLLAMIYSEDGRPAEVAATLAKGVELARRQLERDPGDVRAMYLSAGALVQLGRVEEGLRLLDQVLELSGEDTSVLYNAACVYARAGRSARSRAACASAGATASGWRTTTTSRRSAITRASRPCWRTPAELTAHDAVIRTATAPTLCS